MMTTKTNSRRRRGRVMLLGPERVCYLGLLGRPRLRSFGSLTVYCGLDLPFRFSIDGRNWQETAVAVVPPYQPHWVETGERLLGSVMVEPETVNMGALPPMLRCDHGGDRDELLQTLRRGFARIQALAEEGTDPRVEVDPLFLGQTLSRRELDPRVARVLAYLREDPSRHCPAEEAALLSGLSFSRFLHLFKEDLGITFRKFRAWKRARSLLYHVNRRDTLTDIALDVGYPDSTHFSHSIRQFYGLTPKDILVGSRKLAILLQSRVGAPDALVNAGL